MRYRILKHGGREFFKYFILVAAFSMLHTFTNKIVAQDFHLSQFLESPMALNPALTGAFRGNLRASAHHKSQWASVSTKAFNTVSASVDASLKRKKGNSFLGIGAYVLDDRFGSFGLSSTQVNLSIAGFTRLGGKSYLSVGLLVGGVQTGIKDPENLQWGSQYNGVAFDAGQASGEQLTESSTYGSAATGVVWSFGGWSKGLKKGFNGEVGVAVYHLNSPRLDYTISTGEKLSPKLVFHSKANIAMKGGVFAFQPAVMLLSQGPNRELNLGALFRYTLHEASRYTGALKESALYFGGFYRFGDAFIPAVKLEYGSFQLGLSYDLNLSNLTQASSGRGGFEISLGFTSPNPFKEQEPDKALIP